MRNIAHNMLTASDNGNQTSGKIDSGQLISASFLVHFDDSTAKGTLKMQASNDPTGYGNLAQDFTPTNWVDIPSASVSITGGMSAILPITTMCYRWTRAVYTADAGSQTVTLVDDVSGSLNNTYFLLNSANDAHKYYVWFDDGGGVDPAIPGRTGIQVTYSDNDTAATIGATMATQIAAAGSSNDFTTSGTSTVTITNKTTGSITLATDGTPPTGFTFAITIGGTSTIYVDMNALSI